MGWLATFLQIGSVHPMNRHALEVRKWLSKRLKSHLCHLRVQAFKNRAPPPPPALRCVCLARSGKAVSTELPGRRWVTAACLGPCLPGGHYLWTFLFSFVGKDNYGLRALWLYPFCLPRTEAKNLHSTLFFQRKRGLVEEGGLSRSEVGRSAHGASGGGSQGLQRASPCTISHCQMQLCKIA